MRMIRLAAGLAALFCASGATSAGFADPAAIDEAVAGFTGSGIGEPGGARLPVDRRLKLTPCALPLTMEYYGKTRDSVLVRCPVTGGWRIFVPVMTSASSSGHSTGAPIVARGESVAISVRGRGFSLSRQGEALDGGAEGQWIRVRPAGKRTDPIRARILRPGVVTLDLP